MNDLIKHYNPDALSEEESNSLEHYTIDHNNSFAINQHLWEKRKGIRSSWKSGDQHIKNIQSALHKFGTPNEMTVHSGIDPYFKPEKGKTYNHHAFLSTSTVPHVAEAFAGYHGGASWNGEGKEEHHLLHITVPKGHPGMYIDQISDHQGEYEFLLPHGTKLKHTRSEVEPHSTKPNTEIHHHHMEIIK